MFINKKFKDKQDVVTFLITQLFHIKKRRWNLLEQKLFLKFYDKSPTFYRKLLKLGFILPSVATIRNWHSLVKFELGVSNEMISLLAAKSEEMTNLERKVVFLVDGMAIKEELEYNSKDDLVYGFQDYGNQERANKRSKCATIFMIRGLNKNYRQTIG